VAGWVISAIPGLMIGSSGVNIMLKMPFVIEGLVKYGYTESSLMGMGWAAFSSAVLFLIPRTAMVGAILLTGYLGGATATHVAGGGAVAFRGGFWGVGLGGSGDAGYSSAVSGGVE